MILDDPMSRAMVGRHLAIGFRLLHPLPTHRMNLPAIRLALGEHSSASSNVDNARRLQGKELLVVAFFVHHLLAVEPPERNAVVAAELP